MEPRESNPGFAIPKSEVDKKLGRIGTPKKSTSHCSKHMELEIGRLIQAELHIYIYIILYIDIYIYRYTWKDSIHDTSPAEVGKWRMVAAMIAVDWAVFMPLIYLPVFYTFREAVYSRHEGTRPSEEKDQEMIPRKQL